MFRFLNLFTSKTALLNKLLLKDRVIQNYTWFISHWAHDQRTAANAMSAAVQMMESDGIVTHEHITLLKAGLQLLSDGANNLVDYSRPDTMNRNEIFDLVPVLQGSLDLYRVTAVIGDVRLSLETQGSEAIAVRNDRWKIGRIINNLLSNAIKFSSPGQKVTLRAFINDGELFIQVEDHGMGIAADKQKEIFLPYTKLTSEMPGSGLGLAICKRYAVEMGGDIDVYSFTGRGSIFSLKLKAVNV